MVKNLVQVWKAAGVEFAVTGGLTFLSIAAGTAWLQGKITSTTTLALLQALIYSFAILAAAPVSGGHLNPAITLTTFLAGQASLIRSLFYIFAQFVGGILGAAVIMSVTTEDIRTKYHLGCTLHEEQPGATTSAGLGLNRKQGLFAEFLFTTAMLFVAYGVGFDTRSLIVTFPILSPFIIGGVFGILSLVSQGVGYTAVMNPARCFGPAVVDSHGLWEPLPVFIFGPLMAAVAVGLLQLALHQVDAAEFGHVLPLTFFEIVVPDHQQPGFGPRDNTFFPPERDTVQSSGVLQIPHFGMSPSRSEKVNVVLHIKASMQQNAIGDSSRRPSGVNIVDVQRDSGLTLPTGRASVELSNGDQVKVR